MEKNITEGDTIVYDGTFDGTFRENNPQKQGAFIGETSFNVIPCRGIESLFLRLFPPLFRPQYRPAWSRSITFSSD